MFQDDDQCMCSYCHKQIGGALEFIRHTIVHHGEKQIAVLWPSRDPLTERIHYKNRIFSLVGNDIRCSLGDISLDINTWKLNVPTNDEFSGPK